jgi:hypothetical protein
MLYYAQLTGRMVRAALATSFSASAKLTARKMYADDWIAEVKTAIALPRSGGGRKTISFAVMTALAENLANPSDSSFAVAERAVGMAVDAVKDPSKVVTAAEAWWEAYWNRSSVVLPTRPLVQRVWAGANAALGYIASFNSMVPAPGLDGPFVLSDQPGWNGDYTLDYNFQSPWFGVFSSNHEELVGSYLTTVFEQQPGAAAQAQRYLSAFRNTTTCPATALKFQQHISAYGGGDLNVPVLLLPHILYSFSSLVCCTPSPPSYTALLLLPHILHSFSSPRILYSFSSLIYCTPSPPSYTVLFLLSSYTALLLLSSYTALLLLSSYTALLLLSSYTALLLLPHILHSFSSSVVGSTEWPVYAMDWLLGRNAVY